MIKLCKYYLTLLPEIIFLLIWIGVQCFLFSDTFNDIRKNPKFFTTYELLGQGVALAKACASVINFNASILIITMCQITVTWLRSFTVISYLVPFERSVQLHRLASMSMLLFSLIHTIAHYVNYSKIPTSWFRLSFFSGPGITGHILLIIIFIIMISSSSIVKRWKYECFWYLHQLSLILLLILSLHGSFCFIKMDFGRECPGAKTWKWLIGPISLFIVEFIIKTVRSSRFTFISKVIIHQEEVLEVQIKKPSLKFKPGQNIKLNCPDISSLQWHPFTITSAPEEGFISVHVRIVGDWTRKFSTRLGANLSSDNRIMNYYAPERFPDILVDGPYGSVSENYDQFEVAICIGAGIGQTPFSSILKSMWYSLTHPNVTLKLKKIIFIQICRETQVITKKRAIFVTNHIFSLNNLLQSLGWFLDILKALEGNGPNLLELNCYLTTKLTEKQSLHLHLINQINGPDPVTGLMSKTNYGRPNFGKLFQKWSREFEGKTIGIFYCGPKSLGKKLKWLCIERSKNQTNFKFHQESF